MRIDRLERTIDEGRVRENPGKPWVLAKFGDSDRRPKIRNFASPARVEQPPSSTTERQLPAATAADTPPTYFASDPPPAPRANVGCVRRCGLELRIRLGGRRG